MQEIDIGDRMREREGLSEQAYRRISRFREKRKSEMRRKMKGDEYQRQ